MTRYRRTLTILVSAALTAGLLATAFAAPATAAKPKCAGKVATIVGTAKGEVITGTNKADVIVARGGHDRIYGRGGNDTICGGGGHDKIVGARGNDLIFGGLGRDKLFGGSGRDRLLGGPANDRLAGGPGNDACLQGAGAGLHLSCERPAPPPAPIAPPPGPTLIPLTGILAVAYSDIDDLDGYSTGDVLIAKLVDTNGDGVPSANVPADTIVMGRYPTKLVPTASDFSDWIVKTHTVATVSAHANWMYVNDTHDRGHYWYRTNAGYEDEYWETGPDGTSDFADRSASGADDLVWAEVGSPSAPGTAIPYTETAGSGDDKFIDVELNY
jgi:Ca2+-binding RTX toxin-like protein